MDVHSSNRVRCLSSDTINQPFDERHIECYAEYLNNFKGRRSI